MTPLARFMCDRLSSNIPVFRPLANDTGLYYLHSCDRCLGRSSVDLQSAIKEPYRLPKKTLANAIARKQEAFRWHTGGGGVVGQGYDAIATARRHWEALQTSLKNT